MAQPQFHQSLKMELSGIEDRQITITLKANSLTAQRVIYELRTTGASSTIHKGASYLKANETSTLSNISFPSGEEWCVSMHVEEESGAQYTIIRGNACP